MAVAELLVCLSVPIGAYRCLSVPIGGGCRCLSVPVAELLVSLRVCALACQIKMLSVCSQKLKLKWKVRNPSSLQFSPFLPKK